MQKVWAILQVIERLICDLTNEYIIDIEKDNVEFLSLFKNGGKYRLQESADPQKAILVWEEGEVQIQRLVLIRKNENIFNSSKILSRSKIIYLLIDIIPFNLCLDLLQFDCFYNCHYFQFVINLLFELK